MRHLKNVAIPLCMAIVGVAGYGAGKFETAQGPALATEQREHAAVRWLRAEGWHPAWAKVDDNGLVRVFPIASPEPPHDIGQKQLKRIYDQGRESVDLELRLAECERVAGEGPWASDDGGATWSQLGTSGNPRTWTHVRWCERLPDGSLDCHVEAKAPEGPPEDVHVEVKPVAGRVAFDQRRRRTDYWQAVGAREAGPGAMTVDMCAIRQDVATPEYIRFCTKHACPRTAGRS